MGLPQERVSNVLESSHNLTKENLKMGPYVLLKPRDSKRGLLSKRKISYCIELWCPLKIKNCCFNYNRRWWKVPKHRHQTQSQVFSLQAAAAQWFTVRKSRFLTNRDAWVHPRSRSFLFHLNNSVNGETEAGSSPISKRLQGQTKYIWHGRRDRQRNWLLLGLLQTGICSNTHHFNSLLLSPLIHKIRGLDKL